MMLKSLSWAVALLLSKSAYGAPAPASRHTVQAPIQSYGEPDQTLLLDEMLHIPSRYESTVLARRMLALSTTGYISTNFPKHPASDRIPHAAYDTPIALPDYIAACEEPTGNPTILALGVSTFIQNAQQGSNVSLAISWWDEYSNFAHKQPWSKANLPRLSVLGYLEEIPESRVEEMDIVNCFTTVHSDSVLWLPGSKTSPHEGKWMRLVVEEIYWLGGFGNLNYIGWLDPEEWRNVTAAQYGNVRLPGETSGH